jgi:hypothetical protein
LNAFTRRGKGTDRGLQSEENEPYNQSLDSDEKVQLHAKFDALIEMQERVETTDGSQNKYMASVFQKTCMQITEIDGIYHDITHAFCQLCPGRNSEGVSIALQ